MFDLFKRRAKYNIISGDDRNALIQPNPPMRPNGR